MTFNYATVREAEIRKPNWEGGVRFFFFFNFFIRVTWACRMKSSIHTSHVPRQPHHPSPSNSLSCLSAAHRASPMLWTPRQMKMLIFSHPCPAVSGLGSALSAFFGELACLPLRTSGEGLPHLLLPSGKAENNSSCHFP